MTLAELAAYIRQHPEHSRSFALKFADVLELAEGSIYTKNMTDLLLADGIPMWGRDARQARSD